MATRQTTYGALVNGDRIWLQGYLFTISALARTTPDTAYGSEALAWLPAREVIRFTGMVGADSALARTGYNGGRYGAYAHCACTVEVQEDK